MTPIVQPPTLPLPTISLVTPSFNQAIFLEETLRSVLDQNYPRLEYLLIDGGSKDASVDIIRRYADRLAYWVSEPDRGMYDAINKGFARSTGEIMGWINSDDKLMPWTLRVVGDIFARYPEVEWLTTLFPTCMSADGYPCLSRAADGYTGRAFLRGANLPGGDWFSEDYIQQEGTFWRRSLWERCGGTLDLSLKHAGDFELWARFFKHGARLYGVPVPLGAFRFQNQQKTALHLQEYFQECEQSLRRNGGAPFTRWETFYLRKARKLFQGVKKRYCRHLNHHEKSRLFHRLRGDWEVRLGP